MLFENYFASKIQQFYKKFIKCDRSGDSFCRFKNKRIRCPIDPLYRVPYKEARRIKIIEYDRKYRIYNVWHFNIFSLIDWLNKCKRWTNPLTNCNFSIKSQHLIKYFIEKNEIKRRLVLIPKKRKLRPMSFVEDNNKIGTLIKYVKNNDGANCTKFINEHKNIDLNADLDEYISVDNHIIAPIGFIHLIVERGFIDLLDIFVGNGCNVNKKAGPNSYSALHLCAIMNKLEIGKKLLNFGADIETYCYYNGEITSLFDLCDKIKHYNFLEGILN